MGEVLPQRECRFREWFLALVIGALGIALVYRHQFSSGFDLFRGPRGDTRLIAYLCEHWYQALQGRAALLSPAMFYPAKGTLGYSDVLLLFVPPYSLLRGLGYDIFTALAFTVIGFNILNFIAGFALLFRVLRFRWLPGGRRARCFSPSTTRSFPGFDHLQSATRLACCPSSPLVSWSFFEIRGRLPSGVRSVYSPSRDWPSISNY